MALEIACVPALEDNYIWLAHDADSGETVVVDPGAAAPALVEAARRGWRITQIWNTHWHGDHIGGNEEVRRATGAPITGPAAEADRIPGLDEQVKEGGEVRLGGYVGRVLEVPGHTAGHIAFHLPEAGLAFVGDTLFAMGCGRLFEGTPAQMWRNMERLAALPDDTAIYGAHEYTEGNARFALTVEPDNAALVERAEAVRATRAAGKPTLPTTIALERATNPFMRAGSAEALGRLRAAKDAFR